MVKISSVSSSFLKIEHLVINQGDSWCFVGANDSGITAFINLFHKGQIEQDVGSVSIPSNLSLLSFQSQQEIYEEELRKDDSDFLDYIDPGTPARNYLNNIEDFEEVIQEIGFEDLLDSGYRQLSTGQSRKLLLLQAITSGNKFLVIESPYDGLDQPSQHELNKIFAVLKKKGFTLIITVNNQSDIPDWVDSLGLFSSSKLISQGSRSQVINQIDLDNLSNTDIFKKSVVDSLKDGLEDMGQSSANCLVKLKGGFAGYGEENLFEGLDLTINKGEHTLITGSNGCGKSTLLQILTGDNPKCYSNHLSMFGTLRGSGESIWDVKKRMGIVSPDLHRSYRVSIPTSYVVLSGLYDSIGMYRKVLQPEVKKAEYWLKLVGLEAKSRTSFRLLSFAEQRLVLIARALIKMPDLLILDEPTQGLDESSRCGLLDFLEFLVQKEMSTIVYVSHRQDEYRSFFHQHVQLDHYRV